MRNLTKNAILQAFQELLEEVPIIIRFIITIRIFINCWMNG